MMRRYTRGHVAEQSAKSAVTRIAPVPLPSAGSEAVLTSILSLAKAELEPLLKKEVLTGANRYLIATALGGDANPPTMWSGTETTMNS